MQRRVAEVGVLLDLRGREAVGGTPGSYVATLLVIPLRRGRPTCGAQRLDRSGDHAINHPPRRSAEASEGGDGFAIMEQLQEKRLQRDVPQQRIGARRVTHEAQPAYASHRTAEVLSAPARPV